MCVWASARAPVRVYMCVACVCARLFVCVCVYTNLYILKELKMMALWHLTFVNCTLIQTLKI
jgi:hypothetical protein